MKMEIRILEEFYQLEVDLFLLQGLHRYILPSSCSQIDKLKESDYGTVLSS